MFVTSLSLSSGQGDVDEASGVLLALVSTALGDLGLLLRLDLERDDEFRSLDDLWGGEFGYLGRLRLDLALESVSW